MKVFVRSILFAFVICCVAGALVPATEAQAFYLKNGDTVVFYGDSITEQNFYNQWVELYTVTRFPDLRIHFYGEGVGGDRVTGGGGGTIDERLARDVFPHKPTVVTVMLGMNDGSYRPTTDEIQNAYTRGYEHLLQSIRDHAPGARITLLGPSPYDDVTRPARFPGGYNGVMEHFADLDRDLARRFDGTFISLNLPVVAALQKAEAADPAVALLLLPDRVHPDPVAHWVMAEALLKGWNAPALVALVEIDASAGKLTGAENATVEGIVGDKDGLRWTATEKALPLAFIRDNATQALLLRITDIEQQLNQEPLRVTGLAAGRYKLAIDGKFVWTFSAEELARGINLADFDTPMRQQSQRVGWMVRDRDEANYIHLRMRVRSFDAGSQAGKPDEMDAFANSLEDSIYETAAPKAHVFALSLDAETPKP
jgi:lysophospholipase L1-like esterase